MEQSPISHTAKDALLRANKWCDFLKKLRDQNNHDIGRVKITTRQALEFAPGRVLRLHLHLHLGWLVDPTSHMAGDV